MEEKFDGQFPNMRYDTEREEHGRSLRSKERGPIPEGVLPNLHDNIEKIKKSLQNLPHESQERNFKLLVSEAIFKLKNEVEVLNQEVDHLKTDRSDYEERLGQISEDARRIIAIKDLVYDVVEKTNDTDFKLNLPATLIRGEKRNAELYGITYTDLESVRRKLKNVSSEMFEIEKKYESHLKYSSKIENIHNN